MQTVVVSNTDHFPNFISTVNIGHMTIPPGGYRVVDEAMPFQTYVAGSTTVSQDGGTTVQKLLDNVSPETAFPLDGLGFASTIALPRRGGIHEYSFDVVIDGQSLNTTTVKNTGYVSKSASKYPFEVVTEVTFEPRIEINNTVYLGHDQGASCTNVTATFDLVESTPHSPVTYCYKVTNTGNTWLKNPVIVNQELQSTHKKDNFMLAPGESYFVSYDVDSQNKPVVILNDLRNLATVSATAVWPSGLVIDDRMPPVKHSDPSEVKAYQYVASIKIENTVFAGPGTCETKGAEAAEGFLKDSVTYCFLVTNTGTSYLKNIQVTNGDLKPAYTNVRSTPLAPMESYLLVVPKTIDGNYTNLAKVTAMPSLKSADLPNAEAVTSEDTSSIIGKALPVGDPRSEEKDPFKPPPKNDPPTECMTPHYVDAGGKQDLVCASNDITIKSLKSSRATCKEGENITLTVDAKLYFKTGLYDPAWFVATDGGDAKSGTCVLKGYISTNPYTVADPDGDDDVVGSVAWNQDAIGGNDVCGDVIIPGGSAVVSGSFFVGVPIKCTDSNDDGTMDFSVCFSWRSKAADGFCTLKNDDVGTKGLLADAYPEDNLKCRCVRAELPTVTVDKPTSDKPFETC